MIDIVVMTCDRLTLLKRTLAHIWERTRTPYRLHVIDDASTEGNTEYVSELLAEGRIASALLRPGRLGIAANLRTILGMTDSDPVVVTDDDVLCPQIEPDWLAQGLTAMEGDPHIGVLALNNPACNVDGSARGLVTPGEPVSYCRNVGGTFAFMRAEVLGSCVPGDGRQSPVKELCLMALGRGWRVGYLTHVYCQHIGARSMRWNLNLRRGLELAAPVDPETLEPVDEYKG